MLPMMPVTEPVFTMALVGRMTGTAAWRAMKILYLFAKKKRAKGTGALGARLNEPSFLSRRA
jgi:hypothetical protein